MIILGVILLVAGFLLKISILWTIGIILVVIGVILAIPDGQPGPWPGSSDGRGSEGGDLGATRLTWTRKREGQQHGGKAWSIAEASKVLPRKARVIWRRPDCLKPSLQRCKRHTL